MIISKKKYENLLEKVNRNSRQIMQLNCSHSTHERKLIPFMYVYEEVCSSCGKTVSYIESDSYEERIKQIYKAKSEHYKKLSGEANEHNT